MDETSPVSLAVETFVALWKTMNWPVEYRPPSNPASTSSMTAGHDGASGAATGVETRHRFFRHRFIPPGRSLSPYAHQDPMDSYISALLKRYFEEESEDGQAARDDVGVYTSSPSTSPDIVLKRKGVHLRSRGRNAEDEVIALEVKKLKRRRMGYLLDYSSTPPCGTARIYTGNGAPADIPAYYLFVIADFVTADFVIADTVTDEVNGDGGTETKGKAMEISTLILCDGDFINADFGLYLAITGQRSKEIGLGTYGDGVNRNRPMLLFFNPLHIKALRGRITLIHRQPPSVVLPQMEQTVEEMMTKTQDTVGMSNEGNGEDEMHSRPHRIFRIVPRPLYRIRRVLSPSVSSSSHLPAASTRPMQSSEQTSGRSSGISRFTPSSASPEPEPADRNRELMGRIAEEGIGGTAREVAGEFAEGENAGGNAEEVAYAVFYAYTLEVIDAEEAKAMRIGDDAKAGTLSFTEEEIPMLEITRGSRSRSRTRTAPRVRFTLPD